MRTSSRTGLDGKQRDVILLRLGACLPCTDAGKDLFKNLGRCLLAW